MTTRRTNFDVEVKESPIDGSGVFAKRDFRKDEMIGIVSGYVPEEIDDECWYTCEFEDDYGNWYCVEPTYPFRYLNHSNDPNAAMPSPVLIALKGIKAGEEIMIDYGDEWHDVFQKGEHNVEKDSPDS